jgi:pyruvate dehydrogenase E1 component alpha subunit
VGANYDLDKGLRTKEELDAWMSRCPIKALEKTLLERGLLSTAARAKLLKDVRREVEEALLYAKESPYPAPDEITEHVFKM